MAPPAATRLSQSTQPKQQQQQQDENPPGGTTATTTRRRSLLPQRAESLLRRRPVTVYGAGFRSLGPQPAQDGAADDAQRVAARGLVDAELRGAGTQAAGRDTAATTKTSGSMPPPSGPIVRTQSLRRTTATTIPGGGNTNDRAGRGGPPSAAAAAVGRSHARQSSTSTGGGAGGRTNSRPSSRSGSTTANAQPRPASQGRNSGTTRPPSAGSVIGNPTGHGLARSGSVKENSSSKHVRATSALPSLQSRPQFNTFQQHYSPKKNLAPKPATSSFLPSTAGTRTTNTSVDPNEDLPASGAVTHQQIELLQLAILHAASGPCFDAYRESAKAKLSNRFGDLARRCATVERAERNARIERNIKALEEWGDATGQAATMENLQVLGGVLKELAALTAIDKSATLPCREPKARFDAAMYSFDQWLARAESVWRSREAVGEEQKPLDVLAPMPNSWHAEIAALKRRVAMLQREIGQLDPLLPGSDVAGVVSSVSERLSAMSEGLRMASLLAGRVMDKEMEWVDARILIFEPV